MTVYIFCYDIADSKRRRKTAKQLEKYGLRLHKSFFQIKAEKETKDILRQKLLTMMNLKEDRLYIYSACQDCFDNIYAIGKTTILNTEDFLIL